jgi:hypothetical protein
VLQVNPSGTCAGCGSWYSKVELDHIIPKFEGGCHDTSNLQWLCEDCHRIKTSAEARRRPGKPLTLSAKAKLAEANRGRTYTHSAEAKEKIRQSRLAYHAWRKLEGSIGQEKTSASGISDLHR